MNYTKNYRLPQWVKEDRIMMDDFNAAMSSMESGMTKTAAQAAEAKSIATTAQQTADTAKQGADNAYSPVNKPFVAGTYVGTGADKTFNLGFRPACVMIAGLGSHDGGNSNYVSNYFGVTCGGVLTDRVRLTDTGFTVLASSIGLAPDYTIQGLRYDYIAFR